MHAVDLVLVVLLLGVDAMRRLSFHLAYAGSAGHRRRGPIAPAAFYPHADNFARSPGPHGSGDTDAHRPGSEWLICMVKSTAHCDCLARVPHFAFANKSRKNSISLSISPGLCAKEGTAKKYFL
jgi:hypothetical protein